MCQLNIMLHSSKLDDVPLQRNYTYPTKHTCTHTQILSDLVALWGDDEEQFKVVSPSEGHRSRLFLIIPVAVTEGVENHQVGLKSGVEVESIVTAIFLPTMQIYTELFSDLYWNRASNIFLIADFFKSTRQDTQLFYNAHQSFNLCLLITRWSGW